MGRLRGVWVAVAVFAVAASVALIVASGDSDDEVRTSAAEGDSTLAEGPSLNDHWHVAYGIYVCGAFLPGPDNGRDPLGIHTHGDGLIHIHPFSRTAAGANADLGLFFSSRGDRLDDRALRWEGDQWTEGEETCDGRPGEVVVVTPEARVTTDVAALRLVDCSWVTIAFVGRGDVVPPPPTADEFGGLSDVPPGEDVCRPAA